MASSSSSSSSSNSSRKEKKRPGYMYVAPGAQHQPGQPGVPDRNIGGYPQQPGNRPVLPPPAPNYPGNVPGGNIPGVPGGNNPHPAGPGPNYPGNVPGGPPPPGYNPGQDPNAPNHPGSGPNVHPGSNPQPGNLPGNNPYPGNVPGGNPGNVPGNNPGLNIRLGGNPGNVPGNNPGNVPGGNPGNVPGGNPGNVPGGNPGNLPGGNPGNVPGNNPGPRNLPGGIPQPGNVPGNNPNPGNVPGNHPLTPPRRTDPVNPNDPGAPTGPLGGFPLKPPTGPEPAPPKVPDRDKGVDPGSISAQVMGGRRNYQPLILNQVNEPRVVETPDRELTYWNQEIHEGGLKAFLSDRQVYLPILNELANSHVEILTCMAMYNEDVKEMKDTLFGLVKNTPLFEKTGVAPKSLAVCIVVDGLKPFLSTFDKEGNEGTREFCAPFFNKDEIWQRFGITNGQYDQEELKEAITNEITKESILKNLIGSARQTKNALKQYEIAHVFETKTNFGLEGIPEMSLLFVVKQNNKRKLNSHFWFFGGFCKAIVPKHIQLLDVGTKPNDDAIYLLWKAMNTNPNCAGVAGEIMPMDYSFWNFVVAAQHVEYKFIHIMDKALESSIGFITVLPGAFSAYRWKSIDGPPLWDDYFRGFKEPHEIDCFHSNIYLAEDRVLCLSLVSKPKENNILRYVKSAVATTDVPDSLLKMLA